MKSTTKRFLVLLSGLILVLGLAACNPQVEEPIECDPGYELVGDECQEIVVPDTTAPVFANVGNIAYTIGEDAPDYLGGITATDETDGDLTSSIVVDSSAVDLTVAGTYTVNLSVEDAAGNEATATYDVIVTPHVLTNQEKAELDLELIVLPASYDGIGQLTLPSFGPNGSTFSWTTSDPLIINKSGYVVPPSIGSDPVIVTLTARVFNGTYTNTYGYQVTVNPFPESTVTSMVQLPFENTSEEWTVPENLGVDIFYVDNGSVPYIDMETFVDLANGAIQSDELIFTPVGDDQMEISYTVEYEDFDGTMVTETYTALVDFTLNTFHVDNFDFFSGYEAETESDFGEGLVFVDAEYIEGEEVTIPLGYYNFDLIIYEDGGETYYLMPFHVANLLFLGDYYYDIYYNGDKLWGIDTFTANSSDPADLAILAEARTSSKNAENAPADIKFATYNFLALSMNYFYGLKEDRGVENYYDSLSVRLKSIMNATDNELYRILLDFVMGLDDLHSSHTAVGYYMNDPATTFGLSYNDLSSGSQAFYDRYWALGDLIEEKYGPAGLPEFRLIDDNKTAIIYLTGFDIDTPPAFKEIMDGLPASVENVVVDLSYNLGGNVGAVWRLFGYITEETMLYHSLNPADNSVATYFIESDYVAYDYNWYIISSRVSFSAANLMVTMAVESGVATVMGQHTGGGASSIGLIQTPDGSYLQISTNNVTAIAVGNEIDGYEYLSTELGVDPDYFMSDVTSDSEIIAIIAQHQSETAQ